MPHPTVEELDLKLGPVLRKMETRGIELDVSYLEKLTESLGAEVKKLKAEIIAEVGHDFSPDSPKQLAEILYGELHLDEGEVRIPKTKTGKSTAAQVLEKLRGTHPVVSKVLNYRERKKLLSTYVKPLPKLVDKAGRIHTEYRIDTAAGRLSSKNPNLQNIPVRSEEGLKIRKAFIAPKGKELLGDRLLTN